ncbi:MAG: response regulator [Candidatus Omnitrophota bacterium]
MGKKQILVIDDEVDFVDAVRMRLEPNGYDVIAAHNGQDGMDMARSESPSLILMDLAMPSVNGFEALSRLRSDPRTSRLPIIVVTAMNDIEYAFDAGKLGATDFIVKPVSMESLLEMIRKYA